jgi:hypothetical protein
MSARDLSAVFPPAPASVPPGLTEPSKSYQRHAWLALGGLLAFVALYLGLTGYLAWMVWRLVGNALLHGGNVIVAGLLSIPALFFLAFLVRGLFVVKHSADPTLVELDPSKQPTLFAFIMKLADDTGAPVGRDAHVPHGARRESLLGYGVDEGRGRQDLRWSYRLRL